MTEFNNSVKIFCETCQDEVELDKDSRTLIGHCGEIGCPFGGFDRSDGDPKELNFSDNLVSNIEPMDAEEQ